MILGTWWQCHVLHSVSLRCSFSRALSWKPECWKQSQLPACVAFGTLFNLSMSWFPHLSNSVESTYLRESLEWWIRVTSIKPFWWFLAIQDSIRILISALRQASIGTTGFSRAVPPTPEGPRVETVKATSLDAAQSWLLWTKRSLGSRDLLRPKKTSCFSGEQRDFLPW